METDNHKMSEEDIKKIVELAVEKSIEKLYTEVGKSVIRKGFFLIGTIIVALALWLAGGHVPK